MDGFEHSSAVIFEFSTRISESVTSSSATLGEEDIRKW
jgi:hypothetical protein